MTKLKPFKKEFTEKQKGVLLKKYKHWSLYLSPKQYYIGKLRIVLDRKGIVDMCELRKAEIDELIKITKIGKRALVKAFNPDLFNYATLGNCIRHHHWHIIPRYKNKRIVNKRIFKDNHWNNPAWPNPGKKVDKKTMQIIYDKVKMEIK